MMRRFMAFSLLVVALLAIPAGAQAAEGGEEEGFLFRVNGDVTVPADEFVGTVMVIEGNLAVEGEIRTAILINSNAQLTGAQAETVIIINGTVDLANGSTVESDVVLVNSTLVQDETSTVEGDIVENFDRGLIIALWVIGFILAIGVGILALVAGQVFAAVAPRTARRATGVIVKETGPTILAGIIFWFGAFIVGVPLLFTIIGTPTGIAILLGLAPVMAFLGYLVTGIWIGDWLVSRHRGVGHPYLAAFLGVLILAVVGVVPVLGGFVGFLSAFLGGGALALLGWKAFRSDGTFDNDTNASPNEAQ
jgi:hypothetical protein